MADTSAARLVALARKARRAAGVIKPQAPMRILDAGFHSDRSIRELTHRRQPLMLIVIAALALGATVAASVTTYYACKIAPVSYVGLVR